ncbi:MAG: gamma-glutamyltranspeptidase [Ilumatobacter sp.]|nr:gamma-glutamyltranspeptidase [Ilumatobacter sp.]
MSDANPPRGSVRAPRHLVATADHLATTGGNEMFARGGNAVDAAIAANAAIAVTGPHLCGMGGDLFALVHVDGTVFALNAAGRAGSGADAAAMRAEGLTEMPFRLDVRSVTVPGCVDGWMALHERFGSLSLDVVLAPAQRLAAEGFPCSPLLAGLADRLDPTSRANLAELAEQASATGALIRRPGVARALDDIASGGRDSFYGGEFGAGLIELGGGLFSADDLATSQANWEAPLSADAFGVSLHTIGPSTQGYLALGASRLAERLPLPDDPDDERWAHLLIEAAITAGHDRPDVLHEHADGNALIAMIDARLDEIDTERATERWAPDGDGDTTYLCTAGRDRDGRLMGVSLIQSNASGLGSHLVEPHTGINLHNRGMGFSVDAGHPAEFGPGRRPPHTLAPALATRGDDLVSVFGTMGGDAQPQILLQLAARLFHHGHSPALAVNAGRWALKGPETGFDTWTAPGGPHVAVEGHAPSGWVDALAVRGHRTARDAGWSSGFGHAHAIVVESNGTLAGAADPRTVVGSCTGA